MSDLISKEELYKRTVNKNSVWLSITNSEGKNLKEITEEIPPADIMECARAIKEYCKSKPDNVFLACTKCPFFDGFEKNEMTVCKLFGRPDEWDLPEGEEVAE